MPPLSQDVVVFDWSQNYLRSGLRCLPGLAIVLALGLGVQHGSWGAVAAAGAVSAGFASFQQLGRSRINVMLVVSVGMAISAMIGSLASRSGWEVTMVAAAWAFGYGLLNVWQGGISWIGLQCVIVAVVAGGIPASPAEAVQRGLLTLGGGLLQTGLIAAIWRVFGPPHEPAADFVSSTELKKKTSWWEELRPHLSPRAAVGRYAMQLSVALFLSAGAYQLLHLQNGYWVPMTAVIVLKPEFHQTFARGLARLLGTLVGVELVTLLVALARPGPVAIVVLIVLFAWASYVVFKVNYALFALCITAYVVLLLSSMGLPERQIAEARAISTALGGAITLLTYLLPLPRKSEEADS